MQNDVNRENWTQALSGAGLRLEDLAAATGMSYSLIYRLSRGERRPTDDWIGRVARLLADAEWLTRFKALLAVYGGES
jgi:transcriptional regulator with XRE-family HTH domain